MGLLNIIRRMHLRQKLSIREIARLTGVSRNTVTKHLAADTPCVMIPPAAAIVIMLRSLKMYGMATFSQRQLHGDEHSLFIVLQHDGVGLQRSGHEGRHNVLRSRLGFAVQGQGLRGIK